MSAGRMIEWRVPCGRELPSDVRRARAMAARLYKPRTIPRHAILGGFWDGGNIVRQFMGGAGVGARQ